MPDLVDQILAAKDEKTLTEKALDLVLVLKTLGTAALPNAEEAERVARLKIDKLTAEIARLQAEYNPPIGPQRRVHSGMRPS